MNKVFVIGAIILVLIVVAFGVAFGVSRYLVSKLDGQGTVNNSNNLVQYSSEDGVSFMYPDTYELASQPGAPGDGDTLVLLPKGTQIPEGGEGPPAITMTVIRNATSSLEQWIRTDPRSNFHLSSDKLLAQTTVGGVNAYQYTHSGLYESDAFAVANKGKIYIFAAGWLSANDQIRTDLQRLVSSVQFAQ